ncbi:Transmembrane protein 90B [Chelonia mydas]|uniref:Transmembrane protein 90B n=1 Tax=Chelonia mydas TaxID=8469 RepID=M7BH82_CHEMY|nr:Transmembrane protein 90B [Chelonia mydas]
MDGLLEQTGVLMHGKIAEAGKKNGLINTRNLMAENRDGLVSVYPAPQYQSHIAGNLAAQSRSDPVQQLLDPKTLQQTVESHYRPNIILYSENVLRSWGESVSAECCETTFIEDRSPTKDSLEYPDSKFIDLSGDDIKIHTLSYDVEEDEDFQELEPRHGARPVPGLRRHGAHGRLALSQKNAALARLAVQNWQLLVGAECFMSSQLSLPSQHPMLLKRAPATGEGP